jgi:hypothetical protein
VLEQTNKVDVHDLPIDAIGAALDAHEPTLPSAARCVVVLWSRRSFHSGRVRFEAMGGHDNLDHYMQTKTARVATIEAYLREFVEEVKEQIAGAGT